MLKDTDSAKRNELLKGAYRWTISSFLEYSKLSVFDSPIFYIKGVFWQIRMYPKFKKRIDANRVSTFVSLYIFCLGPYYPQTGWSLKIPSHFLAAESIVQERKEYKFSRESSSRGFRRFCKSAKLLAASNNDFLDRSGSLAVEVELDWESPVSADRESFPIGTKDTHPPFCRKLSDFSLSGHKYSLPTHKLTLATLSPFFEYLVTSAFSENQKNCAFLSDVDEATAKAVIAFAEKRNPFEELKRHLSAKRSKNSFLCDGGRKVENKRKIHSELSTHLKLKKAKTDCKNRTSLSFGVGLLREFPSLSLGDLEHWGLGIEAEASKKTRKHENEWVDALLRLFATGERFSILPLVEECNRRLSCLMDTSNVLKIAKVCLFLSPGWLPAEKKPYLPSEGLCVGSLVEVTTEFILSQLEFFVARRDFARFSEKHSAYAMKLFAIAGARRSSFVGGKEPIEG